MSSSEQASETLPPGTTLGRYEIRRLIGQGGMGSVYEALHRDLKKRVAIKTLLPMLAANEEAKQRFFREGEAASRIRHPHVVDVTDVGAEGATIYLVMEFLQGEDLSALIAREPGLAFDRAADILLPVMAAITTAHEQGVVHRDLKPENIFLATASYGAMVPKVLDFGISKVLDEVQRMALTGTAVTLGTAFYLPPEHLRGSRQADARGDQYALGAILYECLTGQRAFAGETLYAVLKAVGDGVYPPVRDRRPDVPDQLEAIITRAMSLEPAARFASVRQMGRALLPFASPGLQSLWQPFFALAPEPSLTLTPAPTVIAARAITGGTAQMPLAATTPMSLPRTRTKPPSHTTLGGATGEPSDADLIASISRSRSRVPLLAGLALVVVVAVIVVVMRGDHAAQDPARPIATTVPAVGAPSTTAPAVGAPSTTVPAVGAPASAAPVTTLPVPGQATTPVENLARPAPAPTAEPPPAPPPTIEPPPAGAADPAPAPAATGSAASVTAPAPALPPTTTTPRPATAPRPHPAKATSSPTSPPPRPERPATTRPGKGRAEPLPNNAPIVD